MVDQYLFKGSDTSSKIGSSAERKLITLRILEETWPERLKENVKEKIENNLSQLDYAKRPVKLSVEARALYKKARSLYTEEI